MDDRIRFYFDQGLTQTEIALCLSVIDDFKFKFKFKLSFIVIPLHVWTYSGTRCRASQDHGAT